MSPATITPVKSFSGLTRQLSRLRPDDITGRKRNVQEPVPSIQLRRGGSVVLPTFRNSQLVDIDEKLDPNETRKRIRLEGNNERKNREIKIELAKLLAGQMQRETERLQELDQKHFLVKYKTLQREATGLRLQARETRSTDRKKELLQEAKDLEDVALVKRKQIPLLAVQNAKTTSEEFCKLLKYVAAKNHIAKHVDQEVVALTAYYATQKLNKEIFLYAFPTGFFDREKPIQGNRNPGNEQFRQRVTVLGKHYFIDTAHIKSARALEDNENWDIGLDDGLNKAGLGILGRVCTPKELVTLSFPKLVVGENPPIRGWLLYSPGKYQGDAGRELVGRASEWLLRYGEGLVDEDKKAFDMPKVREIKHWGKIFEKHKMRKMLELSKDHTPNMVEALRLGSERLKEKGIVKKNLIGLDKDQIKPWEITRNGMWREKDQNGRMLIDDINDYLDEKVLRKKYAEMFDEDGKPIAKKVRTFSEWSGTTWSDLYNDIATDCLRSSGLRPYEALERKYKDLFGLGENQIKPGEMRYDNMWQGPQGVQTLRERLAMSFVAEDLPGLQTFTMPPRIYFTRSQFEKWYKDYFVQGENTWIKHLKKHNLEGGVKYSIANGNLANAMRLFFGRKLTSLPEIKKLSHVNVMQIMKGKSFSMTFGTAKERQIGRDSERLAWRWLDPERSEFQNRAVAFVDRKNVPCKLEDTRSSALFEAHPVVSALESMNEAFFAAPKGNNGQEQYFFEKMLSAKRIVRRGKTEFIVNEGELRELLTAIKDVVIDEVNISTKSRNLVKQHMENLLAQLTDPRDVLLQAANISKHHKGSNYFGVVDHIASFLFSVYLAREIEKELPVQDKVPPLQRFLVHPSARATISSPDPKFALPISNGARTEIILPGIDQEKATKAIALAKRLKSEAEYFNKFQESSIDELQRTVRRIEDITLACESGDRTSGNTEGLTLSANIIRRIIAFKQGKAAIIKLNEEDLTYEKFHKVLKQIGGKAVADVEIETIALLYCLKSNANPNGFLSSVPVEMFDRQRDDFIKRLQTVVRFNLVNVQKKDNAAKLETFKSIKNLLLFSGLAELANDFSEIELLQMTYPGIFHGINPPVRPWVFTQEMQNGFAPELRKWGHASLLVEEGVISTGGVLDIGKLGRINWKDAYKRTGMENILKAVPGKLTPVDIVREGLEIVRSFEMVGV